MNLVVRYNNSHTKKLHTLTAFKMTKIMLEKVMILLRHRLQYSLQEIAPSHWHAG